MIQRRTARPEDAADEVLEELQRVSGALGAALAPALAAKILAIPDELLGQVVKVCIVEVALQERLEIRNADPDRGASSGLRITLMPLGAQGRDRRRLIETGALINEEALRTGLNISKTAFVRAVNAGRIFGVGIGVTTYFPHFYLCGNIDSKALAKVSKLLGSVAGWSKWQFFTTRSTFLGDATPLQDLIEGRIAEVARSACGFAER
ncbi:hypothetical protein AWB78_07906 [Caballeronia calidae]|uniref:Uncharacterized protein n=1 Tax=Caballeronia calidae TaxID=1777139 RepID=A0A158EH19_9BURK|nr:hypothetical protein [Caballeronia calidae]SAL06155.1 hypothetical protein AWB78_07906 [Caballeronia calidae]